jgi:hypothetical protein
MAGPCPAAVAQSLALSHNADMMTDSAVVPDFLGLVEAPLRQMSEAAWMGSAPISTRSGHPRRLSADLIGDLADDVVLRLEAFPQRKRGRPAQWQSELRRLF